MIKRTTPKAEIQVKPKIVIPKYKEVQFLRLGDRHAEVLYMEHKPRIGIKKLTKTTYKVLRTGEVKEFSEKSDGKAVENVKKAMRRLEQLIKANFDTVGNAKNALFITLTYAQTDGPMTAEKKLFKDFDQFMKRLKRAYEDHKLDYIVVAEPHASGGWHMHMLLKSNRERLYIPNEKMAEIWRQGFTTTVRLKSDDVGAYYTAYFSNVEAPIGEQREEPFPEDAEFAFSKDEETGKNKRFQKGERLRFYPKHFKFYRCSRGIIRPEPNVVKYSEVPKDLGKPRKVKTLEISQTYGKYDKDTVKNKFVKYRVNLIQREIYKKAQEKNNDTE